MPLSPEQEEEMTIEVAEYFDAELKRTLDGMDEGLLMFSKQPPKVRLAGYLEATPIEERRFILVEEYAEMVAKGQIEMSPVLKPDGTMGPGLWAQLAELPLDEFKKWAGDFRSLWRAEMKEA